MAGRRLHLMIFVSELNYSPFFYGCVAGIGRKWAAPFMVLAREEQKKIPYYGLSCIWVNMNKNVWDTKLPIVMQISELEHYQTTIGVTSLGFVVYSQMEDVQASTAGYEVPWWFKGHWAEETKWLNIYLPMPRLHVPLKQDRGCKSIISYVILNEDVVMGVPHTLDFVRTLYCWPPFCVAILSFFICPCPGVERAYTPILGATRNLLEVTVT